MTINGVPQVDIAKAMKLDPKTLRKCYRDVLDNGTIMLCARVARNLGKIATTGRGPAAVSACRYILGCRANWRYASRLEIEPSPDTLAYFSSADAGADARAQILARLAAIRASNDRIDALRANGGHDFGPDSRPAYRNPAGEEGEDGAGK